MAGLRRTIDLIDGYSKKLLPSLKDLNGEDIATAKTVTKGLQVVLVKPIIFEDHSIQRGDAQKPSHLILLDG